MAVKISQSDAQTRLALLLERISNTANDLWYLVDRLGDIAEQVKPSLASVAQHADVADAGLYLVQTLQRKSKTLDADVRDALDLYVFHYARVEVLKMQGEIE